MSSAKQLADDRHYSDRNCPTWTDVSTPCDFIGAKLYFQVFDFWKTFLENISQGSIPQSNRGDAGF